MNKDNQGPPPKNYFPPSETQCKCGCGLDITDELRGLLNTLRRDYGRPITVVSGARCPTYNRQVGGAPQSQHRLGRAADLLLPKSHIHKSDLIMWTCVERKFRGRGFYKTFIHVDIRKRNPAYWVG
jgi:uncharacterized protein YcbK (DUF882 family)